MLNSIHKGFELAVIKLYKIIKNIIQNNFVYFEDIICTKEQNGIKLK
jgi:hypothetical protein